MSARTLIIFVSRPRRWRPADAGESGRHRCVWPSPIGCQCFQRCALIRFHPTNTLVIRILGLGRPGRALAPFTERALSAPPPAPMPTLGTLSSSPPLPLIEHRVQLAAFETFGRVRPQAASRRPRAPKETCSRGSRLHHKMRVRGAV
jgi:hypothetical protein